MRVNIEYRARSKATTLAIIVIAASMSACTLGPNFVTPTPAMPAQWSDSAGNTNTTATDSQADAWWTHFDDALLSSLIERAAASNLDAKQAVLRIAAARAQRDVTAAARWPQAAVNAGFQRQRISENTLMGAQLAAASKAGAPIENPYSQYQLGAEVSWEIDLFGRVRRAVEAANADTQASIEDRHAVMLSLCSEVAQTYIALRGAQLSLDITHNTLATQRDQHELVQQRQSVGLTDDLDVANAAALVANSEAQVPTFERQIAQAINQLSQLLAMEPGALSAELTPTLAVPTAPLQMALGIPADLARQRPDIRRAEARLHAATARVGVAVADLFPRLSLGASAGWQAQDASDLDQWSSRFFGVGPQLELPIFSGGQRRATVRLQDAREQDAALDYQRTVLAALHEVENSLIAFRTEQTRRDALSQAVARSQDAVDLATLRYQSGIASFLEVLVAQRSLQQNQLLLAQSTTAVSENSVALYRALGGGWGAFKDD